MKVQVANKQHVCDSCGMPIPKGHRYWREYREGNGYDDPGEDTKQHTNCAEYELKITAQEKGGTK